MNDERPVLVSMNAEFPFMAPQSAFDRCCATCQSAVMIPPSGQRFLKLKPHAEIMCFRCYRASDEDFQYGGVLEDLENIGRESRKAVPNTRRLRN